MSTFGLESREIIELIRTVFPHRMDTPLPIVRPNACRDHEVLALEQAFDRRIDWTALSPTFLDQEPDGWASALAFLSDEAVCFFIPAYMVADLAGDLTRADPVFALTSGFDDSFGSTHARRGATSEQLSIERWRRLDGGQCRAVAAYLEYKQSKEPHLGATIAPALARYWLDRAG